jgi:hypothetical protein
MPPSISAQRTGGGAVDHLGEQGTAAVDGADRIGGADRHAVEAHQRRVAAVERRLPGDADARRAALEQEQGDAVAFALAAGGAGADDQAIGDVAVEHEALLAAQAPPVADALGAGRDALEVVAALALLIGEREQQLAADQRRQHRGALRLACRRAGWLRRRAGCSTAGGSGISPLPNSSITNASSLSPSPRPPSSFRERNAEPAEPGDVLPEIARESVRVVPVAQRANAPQRRMVAHECGGGIAQKRCSSLESANCIGALQRRCTARRRGAEDNRLASAPRVPLR